MTDKNPEAPAPPMHDVRESAVPQTGLDALAFALARWLEAAHHVESDYDARTAALEAARGHLAAYRENAPAGSGKRSVDRA